MTQTSVSVSTLRAGLSKATTVEETSSAHSAPNDFCRRVSSPATKSTTHIAATAPLYRKQLGGVEEEVVPTRVEYRRTESGGEGKGDCDSVSIESEGILQTSSLIEVAKEEEEEEEEKDELQVVLSDASSRSPRSGGRKGYRKLQILPEPPAEAIIANAHVLEGSHEQEQQPQLSEGLNSQVSPSRRPRAVTEGGPVLEAHHSPVKTSSFVRTYSPKVGRQLFRGSSFGADLVISNEDVEVMEKTKKRQAEGEGKVEEKEEEEEEEGGERSLSATSLIKEPETRALSPLRRSKSENAALCRRLQTRSDIPHSLFPSKSPDNTAQQPSNKPIALTVVGNRRGSSFSEFVPDPRPASEVRIPSPEQQGQQQQEAVAPESSSSSHPPRLNHQQKQPSTIYEESFEGWIVFVVGWEVGLYLICVYLLAVHSLIVLLLCVVEDT